MRSLSPRPDDGFTLVELMVVLGVMAVLVAESVANFRLVQDVATARAAEVDIRNAYESAEVFYVQSGTYTADPAEMHTVEPAYAWTNSALEATSPGNSVYIATADDDQTLVLARRSRDRCYFMQDKVTGAGFAVTDVASGASCVAPADGSFADSWPA